MSDRRNRPQITLWGEIRHIDRAFVVDQEASVHDIRDAMAYLDEMKGELDRHCALAKHDRIGQRRNARLNSLYRLEMFVEGLMEILREDHPEYVPEAPWWETDPGDSID